MLMKKRFNKFLTLLAVLLLGFGQMWGAYAPENNPATKTYGEITFLDVANTKANGKITKTGATFEGDSTLAYSLRYVGQTLAVTTWYNCSDGSPASNFESSPTYADAEINGFVAPSSSSGNIGYGGAKAHSGRVRYFYATGITSVAIISHDNGSSKYVQLKIEEVASDGTLSAVTTIDSPNKSSSTLSLIEYTTALNPSKYYKISCTSNNSSNCKVYQIRFGKYIAPAASYTVTLNPNEGGYASTPDGWTADGSNIKKTVSAGALTIPEPTRATYTFNGWKSGVTAVTLTDGKLTVAKDTTLVAQWLAPCAATAPGDITKGALTAGEITLTADGSAASGDMWYWQDAADGTATDKGTGASKTVDAAGTYYIRSYNETGDCWSVAKSITLEAEDFIAHYAITYNPGTGGSGSIAAGDKTQDVAFTLSSEMFTRTGYVQVGWATTDGGTKAYDLGGSYTTNEAQEFFPVWAEKDTYAAAFACSASAPAGWTFSTDDGWADNKTIAAYVCKFTENGVAAPGNNGMSENWVAFAKNASAVAIYDLGYATTISALNVTLYGGSSSAFNQTIEFVGADGTTVKKSYTNSLGAGNWAANNISKSDVVPNVRYIKVYGASKWVVMSAFSVTYGDLSTKYTVTYSLNGGTGTTPTQSALAAGKTFTLHDGETNITAPTDKVFSNWKDQDDALFAGGAEYTMPAKNVTLTAQWVDASSTYSVTYNNGGHGTAPDAESAVSVVLAELSAEGWAHKGWTANVDVTVDAATVEAGTLIANGKTAILASDVTFTAVWKEIFTVTFDAKGGSAVASVDVEDGATLAAAPEDPTKDDYIFQGWSETDGGDVVADITAITISADKTFFAKWALDVQVSEIVFSNSFKGWIHDGQVEVFYMAGESAPTIVSYDGKNLKAEGGVVISGDKIVATGTDESVKEFSLTMTAVAPLTATGAQTFDGSEGYVKTRHAWTSDKKWKMSKYAEDGRVARGETSMYIFLGAAESVTLDWGAQKVAEDAAVYVNGTFVKNIGKNNNSAIELSNGNNMVALYSLQTSGDVWLNGLTTTPWVPVTAVTLKEGEAEISSKEIWASTSFTLTAEVTPDNASNKTITWTSSNNDVATVVNGVVTGVAANASPVTITASTVDGVTATCEVTVTAAPEPSAAPTISTQPASTNYYEGATIAALEVVATGESLSYQWYLGADAISGAEAATYTPTVSAIGSYVYHCVVTNTEAGHLPTSLASSDATITISEDPSAIKLINKSTGAINTTNFITGVTANDNVHGENGAIFGSSSSNASVKGLSGLNKVVVYNATTTQTKIKLVLYNTNSAAQEVVLSTMAEGDVDPVGQAISVPSKELYSTGYITYNSTENRTFYLHTKSTNVQISQIQVIESGEELAVAGKKDYSLNLNKGRVYAYASSAQTWEGLSMNLGSNYSPATTEYITFKDNALSFSVPNDVCLTITPARAGDKYYVTDVADGTDNATTTVAGTPNSFDLTGGVGKVWYIRSQGSNVQLTNIAFSAPKCAEPAFNALANSDICSGDPYVALDGTATVADAGVPTYQWYREDDTEITGETNATYTPDADGKYYVIAINHLAGFSDNEKKSDLVTVTTHAGTAITEGLVDLRGAVDDVVTLEVVASGKNLHYAWKESATIDGTYTDVEGAADAASLNVTITAGMNKYYKVVVTSDCGSAQESIANVTQFVPVAQADVTGSIAWNWANAASVDEIKLTSGTTPKKNEGFVMANGAATIYNNANFESDKLYLEGEFIIRDGKFFQGQTIKFNTTKAGAVRVKFSHTGNATAEKPARELYVNGVATGDVRNSATAAWSRYVEVPAGEVVITAYYVDLTPEAAQQYIRVSEIEFLEKIDSRTGYAANELGTACYEYDAVVIGATAYMIAGINESGYIVFDEIGELEAGKPYLFEADGGKIFFCKPIGVTAAPLANGDEITIKGMVGTFTGTTLTQGADDLCYFSGRHLWRVNDFTVGVPIPEHRCYVNYDVLKAEGPASAPAAGRRRISMGVNGENQAQGFENLDASETPMKVMIDGTLYIIRGEKVFDATGRLVK